MDPIIREIILTITQMKKKNRKTITTEKIRKILGVSGNQTKETRRIAITLSFLEYPVGVLEKLNDKIPHRYKILDNFEEDTRDILPLCKKENWRNWRKSKKSLRSKRY